MTDFKSQRWNDTAASYARTYNTLPRCACCDRNLTGAIRWLELDQRSDTYHDFGGVPEDQSQGWFPFGLICARKQIELARKALQ